MRLFGLEITLRKAASMSAVDTRGGGWFSVVKESFAGAWQNFFVVDGPREVVAFGAVFACVTQIASDIAKMRMKLVREMADGTCVEVPGQSPYRAVLERPNHYQNRITFLLYWIASKLLFGNAYALKQRDGRGIVTALYILDPQRVTPMVSEGGEVFYRLSADHLSGLKDAGGIVPAREIIHDLMCPLWHPLVGVSPLYASGMSATMGNRILRNSAQFFGNMSRPSGLLVAPGKLTEPDAAEMKRMWNENYSQGNFGQTAVLANGLKYEPMGMPAEQAQLIEQLKWTIEDVARCFHMPLYKIGGAVPANASVDALSQGYYSECLQILIEALELSLKEGLALPSDYYVECDLDGLLRMDTVAMVTAEAEAVKAGFKAPNEARRRMNLPPVKGGESPYLQQQNYSLAALAKRDAKEDPFKADAPKPAPAPAPAAANDDDITDVAEARAALALILKEVTCN